MRFYVNIYINFQIKFLLYINIGITIMEDGKLALVGFLATNISTSEHMVSYLFSFFKFELFKYS